jgi:pimeloyl-ACP methyl ester carboxylesterase
VRRSLAERDDLAEGLQARRSVVDQGRKRTAGPVLSARYHEYWTAHGRRPNERVLHGLADLRHQGKRHGYWPGDPGRLHFKWFRKTIPSANEEAEIVFKDAGHFLQEDKGEEIADRIQEFLARRSIRE